MLYLDYSRKDGQWMPNIHGGRENLESIVFLKKLNDTIKAQYPQTLVIAEESTAWPQVSGPTSEGGLGFDMKWNMGWMHDTLKFFRRSPSDRGFYPDEIAFCLYYAFSEKFCLSLSHDEVVHGKGSLLAKMPDKDDVKFASLRALLGYMYAHPGKKLLFMGVEIGQWSEWDHEGQLQWELLEYPLHQGMKSWVNELNKLYKNEPALHSRDFTSDGFEWLDMGRNQEGVFSFIRKGPNINDAIVVVCNFKNEARKDYKVGLPQAGLWVRILSSEDAQFGGCHQGGTNDKEAQYQSFVSNGYGNMEGSAYRVKEYTMSLELPPLSVTFYKKAK
jgi:1,4-alpha-glucan branching enzyme